MKLLEKIYEGLVFASILILFPLILLIWVICEVMSRVTEKQLEKVENGGKKNG